MPQTIDVTGLPPAMIQAVESLVGSLRENVSQPASSAVSVFDLFGKAPQLRTGQDIAQQIQHERNSWGDA